MIIFTFLCFLCGESNINIHGADITNLCSYVMSPYLFNCFFGGGGGPNLIIERDKIITRINGSNNERITNEKYSYKRLFHRTVKPHTSQTTDIKELLDEVFVISRIIKIEVEVISRSRRLRLIILTETLVILDITKTESNNRFIIHWTNSFLLAST